MKSLLAAVCFLSLAATAQAGSYFIYDNYGNSIVGSQGRFGGMASDNWGNAIYWSGNVTPAVPLYSPRYPIYQTYPLYGRPMYPTTRGWVPYQMRGF